MRTEEFGRAFEHFLIEEIRAWVDYKEKFLPLAYWRTSTGLEVDLIIGDLQLAVEFKASCKVDERDLKGLRTLWRIKKCVRLSFSARILRSESSREALPSTLGRNFAKSSRLAIYSSRCMRASGCPCKSVGGWPTLSSTVDILDLDAAPCFDTPSGSLDSLKKSGIMLQPVVKPVVLRLEADQKTGRPAMPRDHHLFFLCNPQKLRKIIFDFRKCNFLHTDSPACLNHSSACDFATIASTSTDECETS
jgi:hypothetical protein